MKKIIGVMGPGARATDHDIENAREIGRLAAEANYAVLTGDRPIGVMEAALRGAKEAGGQTIAILPSKSKSDASRFADIVIATGMNSARNYVNILTADVIVACGVEAGTLSEIALAFKEQKTVVLLTESQKAREYLAELGGKLLHLAHDAGDAMKHVNVILKD
jgi:hypothetical protein